jgi:DNA-binding PadR family transcriptional regulator
MSSRLSDTSYAVLGLVDRLGPATPYQLKQFAQGSLFYFWTIPHTQIYSECARLAQAGLLEEQREDTGRRRRTYRLTKAGRTEFERWRDAPQTEPRELRDPALLKLFYGADPAMLAPVQIQRHTDRLQRYLKLRDTDIPDGARHALQAGISQERDYVRFWTGLTTAQQTPHDPAS